MLKNEQYNPLIQLVNVKDLIANNTLPGGTSSGTGDSSKQSIVLPYYTPVDEEDRTLVFESRFESGNLAMAYKISDQEYNCILSNDINTKGHTQCKSFGVNTLCF